MDYTKLSAAEWQAEYDKTLAEYENWKAKELKLNISRGRPSNEHIAAVSDILTVLDGTENYMDDGVDAKQYGNLSGLPSARKLYAEILGCKPEQVFMGGNSSLQLMYDTIAKAMTNGLLHSEKPWSQQGKLKWLCPAPGYDRHFQIAESFGFELVTVPMTENGPDMDVVERLICDPTVKGMWNVPKYTNPDGIVYSDETIERLAKMKPAAPDFLLIWDNAYCIHDFDVEDIPFPDILSLCEKYGNADMVFEFASTAKMIIPGAGISCFACSEANMAYISKLIGFQIISYDKINQLRHVKYMQSKAHAIEIVQRQAKQLRPKFDAVISALEHEAAPRKLAKWHTPKGGYFVSCSVMPGCAKRTIELCKEAGVVMAKAGSTFPYGIDPQDSHVRIAPTRPSVEEITQAMAIFCVSLRLAALELRKPQ